ncbi:hypothetical protein CEP52_009474 [Fusarium oligoseptatum]|uniref:ribonuclease H n=1 Tax=Fusarium oligoseptatum TaxID=2604345 RepID=A0A428TCQ9_9HYPO|nr:hypothetical protein CEP52_009474 [Fusarium oligoseptatum]
MKYYAVAIGRITGVFETWDETKSQVNGYSGARHKSFKSREEAQEFVNQHKIESDPVVGRIIFEEPEGKMADWMKNSPGPRSSQTKREDNPTSMADEMSGEWLLRLQRAANVQTATIDRPELHVTQYLGSRTSAARDGV